MVSGVALSPSVANAAAHSIVRQDAERRQRFRDGDRERDRGAYGRCVAEARDG